MTAIVGVATGYSLLNADIASANLVLWGDPSSNAVLAKVIAKLPVKWSADGVVVGSAFVDAVRSSLREDGSAGPDTVARVTALAGELAAGVRSVAKDRAA